MVMTRGSKRKFEEGAAALPKLEKMTLDQAKVHSKQAPCIFKTKRSKASSSSTIIKERRVGLVANGTSTNTLLSEGIHDIEIHAKIQSMSSPLLSSEAANANPIELIAEDHGPEASTNSNGKRDKVIIRQASSFNLTEMAAMAEFEDDCSSFKPETNNSLETVYGYPVKPDLAPMFHNILSKYGDITANSSKKSVILRSTLLEKLCTIIHTLQGTEFGLLKSSELNNWRDFLQDLVSDNVEIGWLCKRLDEIREAKQLLKLSPKMKQAKTRESDAAELLEKEIKEHEREASELLEKANSLKNRLTMARENERKLAEMLDHAKSMVKRFHYGSMVDGLL